MTTWNEIADKMLATDGPAALVCRQWLMPAEGRDAVIFPPTFAAPEGGGKDGYKIDADLGSATLKVESRRENSGKAGYNIDEVRDANDPNKVTRIAIIDTVGSQANRMEPLFKKVNGEDTPYSRLVPQIEIKAGKKKIVNLLDAGHRAADAIVRYSTLGEKLENAFNAYQDSGDATELARIAPTSLVFGAWDSRGTGAKLPRLVASTIRAYDVDVLKRSAQYFPPIDYVKEGLFDDSFLETKYKNTTVGSYFGLKAAPAEGTHGGVIVHGEIRREAILNLVCLRAIGPKGQTGDALRRYILGLALVAISYDRPHDLRQGCLLVKDPDRPSRWEVVFNDGSRQEVAPDGSALLAFAQKAADDFGERKSGRYEFWDPDRARAEVEKEMEEKGSKKGKSRKGKNGDSNQ